MELVQNVGSAIPRIRMYADAQDDRDDHDRNLNIAISHCADVLGSTYEALNWFLSAIHHDPKGYTQYHRTSTDVISHARARLDANLGSQKTCMEVFDGTKYSMAAQSFKQVTTSTQELLSMLQVPPGRGRRAANAGLKFLQTPNVTVCKDGNGNFRTIMEAVAAAPNHSQDHFVILVKKRFYKENVKIDSQKWNLVMIGEGMDVTTISGSRSFRDAVSAEGFIAMDIGFENAAGPEGLQAVALLSASDGAVFYRCKISGYQDSLCVHVGRQFYRDCQISGSVDFIFGYGTAVFQNCALIVRKNVIGKISVVTAHGRYAPTDSSGFSFQSCKIHADPDFIGNAYLGRPWGEYSRTVFIQSYISNVIMPEGAELAGRVKWTGYHVIANPSEADWFTAAKFIDGNSWLPSTGIPYIQGLKP
ncbi:putative pectinesterase/pectinesterase inhibitor 44 [Prunus yedoensis var. nudiflora]|uniref:Pectinesterase n=1 Tax=Prunus yedoensis var. nudiflora TaxID=2094558 RepID=A0A314YLW4_PRUYE|nr:putative pectinesterase/pectinesterase inhibitor 44 [Prunus yedoensis var. nudiflora]